MVNTDERRARTYILTFTPCLFNPDKWRSFLASGPHYGKAYNVAKKYYDFIKPKANL